MTAIRYIHGNFASLNVHEVKADMILDIVGRPINEAIDIIKNAGLKPRIVMRDGVRTDVFKIGYDLDRVNVCIQDGKVVRAYTG